MTTTSDNLYEACSAPPLVYETLSTPCVCVFVKRHSTSNCTYLQCHTYEFTQLHDTWRMCSYFWCHTYEWVVPYVLKNSITVVSHMYRYLKSKKKNRAQWSLMNCNGPWWIAMVPDELQWSLINCNGPWWIAMVPDGNGRWWIAMVPDELQWSLMNWNTAHSKATRLFLMQ